LRVILPVDTNVHSAVSSTIIGQEEVALVGAGLPRKEQTAREEDHEVRQEGKMEGRNLNPRKARPAWRMVFALVLLCWLGVGSSAASEAPSLSPIVTDDSVVPGDPQASEGAPQNRNRLPENPGDYQPMPIPQPAQVVPHPAVPDGQSVKYNVATGVEERVDALPVTLPESQEVPGGPGARAAVSSEFEARPRDFGSLGKLTDLASYPWSANVKLFFEQGGSYYVGSGVLIDPLHVLTAGHCVHSGPGGDWSGDMIVVPAYENWSAPYGTAGSANLMTWSGWADYADFDYDMGLIELDRPIGALTGWHGYGYSTDTAFYTTASRTWYNPGYPAESPFDGEYMYWWYGYFDSCTAYQARFESRSYGGQSGSGAYYVSDGNRYVHLVLSNGSDTWTRDVRITSARFNSIQSSWIGGNTPSTYDLIPLDVRIAPASLQAGTQLTSMSYVVHNYSSASRSGTVSVKVYLSTNDLISTSDTLLQTHQFTYAFAPKSTVRITLSTLPTVPVGTSAGNYYVGVILDVSDASTSNNDSSGQDAAPLSVTAAHLVSAPSTPSGPSSGLLGTALPYSTGSATCNQGHSVEYRFDWGDATFSSWSSSASASHAFAAVGTYHLRSQARCASDNSVTSAWSSTKTLTVCTIPPAPSPPAASDGSYSDRVRISWGVISGATRYEIHRAAALCGTYTKIGESTGSTYDDLVVTAGQVYWYEIKACTLCGCGSLSSANSGYSIASSTDTSAVFRVDSAGNVRADAGFYGTCYYSGAADVAEWVAVSEPVEAGDVLELDPWNPGQYRKAVGPCSSLVAGVVSTEPGFALGSPTHYVLPTANAQALLALVGMVPVKACDENGPIALGDLLVPSSIPGYVMRWDDERFPSCMPVGKALQELNSGTGVILILLMR
jgi:V8-like Glu-specific endopeptidase